MLEHSIFSEPGKLYFSYRTSFELGSGHPFLIASVTFQAIKPQKAHERDHISVTLDPHLLVS